MVFLNNVEQTDRPLSVFQPFLPLFTWKGCFECVVLNQSLFTQERKIQLYDRGYRSKARVNLDLNFIEFYSVVNTKR